MEPVLWQVVDARSLAQGHAERLAKLPHEDEIDRLRPSDLVAVVVVASGVEELLAWTLCGRIVAVLDAEFVLMPICAYDELAIGLDDRIVIKPEHIVRCQHFATPADARGESS